MEIKANAKGTRFINVSKEHLETIRKYSLLTDLVDSNGYVDETTVSKLQSNARALLEASEEVDKDLLNLCFDVIYHRDMKPVALRNLMLMYINCFAGDEPDLTGFSADDLVPEASEED